MSEDIDADMDLIMKRKLLELQRRAASQAKEAKEAKVKTPRDIFVSVLYDRGEEVLDAAERQYPKETKLIVEKVAQLVQDQKLKEKISGGALLWLFRQFGMKISIETTINIAKDGKLVSLADKLKQD